MYPNLCVIDANVVIDLDQAGFLGYLLRLPFRVVIPDSVVSNELRTVHVKTSFAEIEVAALSWQELERAMALYMETAPSLSLYDIHTLVLADSWHAVLLTGDRLLRKRAEEMGLTVHGILWLLDAMVALEITGCVDAIQAIEQMLAAGSRLPEVEIRRLKERWGCLL